MNERQTDFERLQQFVRAGNQSAFGAVVRQHLDLVYATALRKVEDREGAEEISQNVFSALARKAWRFAPDDSLPAWLHKTALLESKTWLRGELRRRRREQTATELGTTMKTPDEHPAFNALVPMLDEALLSLREKDRTALLLRYYESRSLREVGSSLGVGEDAAQKRVAGALEKLAAFFQGRGFKTATVAATTAALQHTAASASVSTATLVVNAALQSAPPALTGLTAFLSRLVSLTKAQTAAVCVAIIAVPMAWEWKGLQQAMDDVARVQTQLAAAQAEHVTLRTRIERLRATAENLDASLAVAAVSARQRAIDAGRFEAWKNRIRGLLNAADYRWPEDSPFVRIPKSALPKISPRRTVTPPGNLAAEARELLGLTPQEREAVEGVLHDHFVNVEGLMEARLYETNRPSSGHVPASAVATKTLIVPPLGDEAKARADQMLMAMKETLGEERWALVAASLESHGTHTLRRILNLDAPAQQQEITVWVTEDKNGPVTGFAWTGGGASFSTSGRALSAFLPDANSEVAENVVREFRGNDLPDPLIDRMLAWLRQEAVARAGKESRP